MSITVFLHPLESEFLKQKRTLNVTFYCLLKMHGLQNQTTLVSDVGFAML